LRDHLGLFNELAHQTQTKLLHILTRAQAEAPTTADPITRVVGTFYGSCLTFNRSLPEAIREQRCFAATDSALRPALGQLFTRAILPPSSKTLAETFATTLRTALRAKLQHSQWMGDSTRTYALTKLAALSIQVGTPDSIPDYTKLTLSPTNYTQNRLAIQTFKWQLRVTAIGRANTQGKWLFSAYGINAAEHNETDMLEIPSVLWQFPLFDPNGDVAANYGGIGALIGHEMMHGFGTRGRYFGAHQVRLNWIFPPDTAAFTDRIQRLAQQFDAFVIRPSDGTAPPLHVDGKRSLEEDLADVGGLRIAYDAFMQAMRDRPRTPINGFTPEQRFFLAFANLHRSQSVLPPAQRRYNDVHPPDRFRVNGAVSNMPEFAKAFGCKAGDPMVRAADQRVEIW
jgi:putative endopeptidase